MRALFALIATAALLGASPALAQLEPKAETGTRMEKKPEKIEPKRAGFIMKNFARCVYRANPTLAVRLLANSDPVSIDFTTMQTTPQKLTDAFAMGDCLGEEMGVLSMGMGMRMNVTRLRPLMAEEDYLFRLKTPSTLAADATETLPRSFVGTAANQLRARSLADFADCIVFRDPARADALLRTTPNSIEEGGAARALSASLGACLVQGQTIELTAPTVRAIVADGLWMRFAKPLGAMK